MSSEHDDAKLAGDYIETNRRLWDELADIHASSAFYDVAGFKAGANSLSEMERAEVGEVRDKRLLHLLCGFGLDTLSWARLGATVTGVDLSERAIETARGLAADCGIQAEFACCDVLAAPEHVAAPYDVVYMSWGALRWISDFPAFARIVANFLVPAGVFYAVDRHPLAMALDEDWTPASGSPRFAYDYESGVEPYGFDWGPDYADPDAQPENRRAYVWAHGLGRIVTALIEAGLIVDFLHEHDRAGWKMLKGLEDTGNGWWVIPAGQPRVPLSFSIKGTKR